MQSFDVKNLESGFWKAKETVPKNMNDKVYKNISKGHMMEIPNKSSTKSWALTNSGERFVENGFQRSKS